MPPTYGYYYYPPYYYYPVYPPPGAVTPVPSRGPFLDYSDPPIQKSESCPPSPTGDPVFEGDNPVEKSLSAPAELGREIFEDEFPKPHAKQFSNTRRAAKVDRPRFRPQLISEAFPELYRLGLPQTEGIVPIQ
jgi:hypothetical protein